MNEKVIYTTSALEGYERDIVYATHAGFGIRFVAFLIDLLIIAALKTLIIGPIMTFTGIEDQYYLLPIFSISNLISAVIYFIYFILMTWFFKATLGKMICGLKVISFYNQSMTFFDCIIRELFGRYISNSLLGLPYLIVLFNPKKQGIHDMLSDTIVVRERQISLRSRIINSLVNQNNTNL